ncbi:MAG: helix-turn-helix transcriptional regulator [Actinomycetota bacterium]|nr:helix-turn-helix transcriptional regulator [Actinomycetota bacterium]
MCMPASRLASSVEPARTQTSLVIEPATPTDLAPLIVAVYRFTRRESAVLQRLLQGLPAKRIAAELEISLHTVRDHTKAIFNKAGVGSRGELIAEIYHSSSRW